ncbi:gamma-glutamylcyclotransferase [Rhodoferax sp. BAB1]|uniref:gamma-glutamylcyclotransferase family protein n=1 Tax=Rhodoferax sp. BAB1 TaxID=2741720 RepID=UPI0020C5B74F|nr:gamma-glutamylcyclotransferase family protein [Rhodoferax sp. BAB1]
MNTLRSRPGALPMTTQPDRHVFVYGTLRRGEANDINRLQPAPLYLGPARISGALYDLGPYPGLVLGGADQVQGEVYAIAPELERQLDVIEEVAPVPSGEYVRRHVELEFDGRLLRCLVYEIAAQRVQGRARIRTGDWLRRR